MFYELRSGLKRSGSPLLVESLEGQTGYRSIYGFPDKLAKHIEKQGSTFGIRGQELYSDTLFIDIDDNPAAESTVEQILLTQGVGFDMYDTGNRGKHFHIPITEMLGKDVPYKQKAFVEANYPGADLSIYKCTGIIRLPGTFHYKNPGKTKKLLKRVEGPTLDISLMDIVPEVTSRVKGDNEAEEILDASWLRPVYSGGRNRKIYTMAFLSAILDYPIEETTKNIMCFNSSMVRPPLDETEVLRTIKSAYRGSGC